MTRNEQIKKESNHKADPQQNEQKKAIILQALKKANVRDFVCAMLLDEKVYVSNVSIESIVQTRLSFRGNGDIKVLAPYGKQQAYSAARGGEFSCIGTVAELDAQRGFNRGVKAENLYAKKTGYKIHSRRAWIDGGDIERKSGKNAELKFFNYDDATGTPSTRLVDAKADAGIIEMLGL